MENEFGVFNKTLEVREYGESKELPVWLFRCYRFIPVLDLSGRDFNAGRKIRRK